MVVYFGSYLKACNVKHLEPGCVSYPNHTNQRTIKYNSQATSQEKALTPLKNYQIIFNFRLYLCVLQLPFTEHSF